MVNCRFLYSSVFVQWGDRHEQHINRTGWQRVSGLARLATTSFGGKTSERIRIVSRNPSLVWKTVCAHRWQVR